MDKITYADAGVNTELGDDVSKILYNAAKETWKNRKGKLGEIFTPFDDFSGLRAIDVSNLLEGTLMNMGFDGVGTKMELAERIKDHTTIAHDLFAMVCDDAVVRGAEPVLVGSLLDVRSLGTKEEPYIEQVNQLAVGYINAANLANVAVINGEVAELGGRVGGFGPFNYNWGAAVVWFAKKDRLFTGYEIEEGDRLVGVGGYRAPDWQDIKKLMGGLFKFYNKNKAMNPVELAGRIHYKFEKIHPFGDGNGRVGRLIMNYILWHKGHPIIIVEYKKRKSYYNALKKGEEKFLAYFIRRYLKNYERYLK